jgi:hypothetical protein
VLDDGPVTLLQVVGNSFLWDTARPNREVAQGEWPGSGVDRDLDSLAPAILTFAWLWAEGAHHGRLFVRWQATPDPAGLDGLS